MLINVVVIFVAVNRVQDDVFPRVRSRGNRRSIKGHKRISLARFFVVVVVLLQTVNQRSACRRTRAYEFLLRAVIGQCLRRGRGDCGRRFRHSQRNALGCRLFGYSIFRHDAIKLIRSRVGRCAVRDGVGRACSVGNRPSGVGVRGGYVGVGNDDHTAAAVRLHNIPLVAQRAARNGGRRDA